MANRTKLCGVIRAAPLVSESQKESKDDGIEEENEVSAISQKKDAINEDRKHR